MNVAGHHITKNTVVGCSLGGLASILTAAWAISDIGRPLFAADLQAFTADVQGIERKIDLYQTGTAIQILNIRKAALETELRKAKRDLRRNPGDDDAAEDVDTIVSEITRIDADILCHRTDGCEVIGDT